MQYFHTHVFDFDRRIASPLVSSIEFRDGGLPIVHTVPRKNDEVLITYLLTTLYRHGTVIPELFGGYDSRGVNMIVPSLTYQLGTNVRFSIKYAMITGTFANLGAFRDRDELLFRVQYDLS